MNEPLCPMCGSPLLESKGKLTCPSRDHMPYSETCSDGACGCVEGADWEEPEDGTEETS
jgi:uncharacterized Zn finger protein (UPF0148 family)